MNSDILAFAYHDLLAYAIGMLPGYETPAHVETIANRLERLESRKINRLMVAMPPRHGKSYLISQFFPTWYLGRHPEHEVIFASYSQDVASDFGRKVRNIMTDPLYQRFFPRAAISEDSAAANRMNLIAGGAYYAVGAGGPLTGRGANLIIIDDIHKNRQEADSEVVRKRIIEWWKSVVYTRLMPGGTVVMVQTRWRDDDLLGTVLSEQGQDWNLLSLPAISDDNKALWPERYNFETLEEIKRTLGTRDFEALYQQRPTGVEGNIIKKSWIKYYDSAPTGLDQVIITADLSYKEGPDTDFTSIQAWGKKGANFYMLDHIHARMGFPDQITAIREMAKRHPQAWAKYVEAHANGQAVIDFLKNEIMGLIPIKPMTSKEARLAAVSPLFEAGNVYFPNPKMCTWVDRAVYEIVSFPSAAHDDIVDAAVYALSQFSSVHNSFKKISALASR